MVCTYIVFCEFKNAILGIVVNFEQMTYDIDEDNGPVQPVLVLSNPSSTTVTVEVLNMDESASGKYALIISMIVAFDYCIYIENTDYNSGPYTVIYSPGVIRYQFDVVIIDDNVLENDESFRLSINASSLIRGITVGSVDQAIVNILDEDSKFNKEAIDSYIAIIVRMFHIRMFHICT